MKMKINFTHGTLQQISPDYFDLTLYRSEKVVYKSSLNNSEAAKIWQKHEKINLIKS